MKTISLKLTDGLDQQLTATARTQRKTKSDLMRAALQAFLNGETGNPSGSCLDLAGDLVGSVDGPSDLSCNRQHMRGFGA